MSSDSPQARTYVRANGVTPPFAKRGRKGGATCGGTDCLDSFLAGTVPTIGQDQLTLAQVFLLSTQHGTTSAEIYYGDLECAAGATCALNAQPQISYLAAVTALASGQPMGTSALMGSAKLFGSASLF